MENHQSIATGVAWGVPGFNDGLLNANAIKRKSKIRKRIKSRSRRKIRRKCKPRPKLTS